MLINNFPARLFIPCIAGRGQSRPHGTAVVVVVHVGTGNPTLALRKSSKCSSPLSHLSRFFCPHFKNIYLCYFYVCACVSLFIWHVCAVPTEIREGVDPLELEFQVK